MGIVSFPKLNLEFQINSTAFSMVGMEIKWYGILITSGLALAILYALKRAKGFGLIPDKVFDIVFIGVVGGFIGARTYFVLFNLDAYKTFTDIINVRQGGLAVYGGIIGSVLAALITAKIKKVKIMPLLDLAGLGFLIGQSIGRWGNFFNQEAYGEVTELPWGMTGSKIPEGMVHPCFLYESIWCAAGFAILHFYSRKKRRFDGEIFLMYTAWYGMGRFFIEGLRTDSLYLERIRVSQLVAAVTAIGAVVAIVIIRTKLRRNDEYVLYAETQESKEQISRYETAISESKKAKQTEKTAADKPTEPTEPAETAETAEETEKGSE